jgi:hypothetical protein
VNLLESHPPNQPEVVLGVAGLITAGIGSLVTT